MKRRLPFILVVAVVVIGGLTYYVARGRPRSLVITGIVSTDEVIVSPEIQGRLQELRVQQGDTVKKGELLARIQPQPWQADMAYYRSSEQQNAALVAQAKADLRYQQAQTSNQVWQAEANLASAQDQVTQAEADLEIAHLTLQRDQKLYQQKVESAQDYDQSRTTYQSAQAHVAALRKQVQAAQAAVASARANADQTAAREAALQASQHQLAAAGAQKQKAKVELDYTEIHAPISGIVDVRAALQGEVVNPGQAIVTLINPDDLWVRADVAETYIDRIHLGEKLTVRLPSGATRIGTVYYRGVDADYATQRDVSRTKRDIKTFQVRLRCNNQDRALAVGMTAYVILPLDKS